MSRRVASLAAVLTLLVSLLGPARPVAAATPIVVDDGPVIIQKDAAPATVDVLANDTVAVDATITGASDPAGGSVVLAADGRSLTYQPDAGFTGFDTFTYTVTDSDTTAATATVRIDVNAPPVAVDDTGPAILEDAAATTIDVLGNDSDPELDPLAVTAATDGAKGTVAITNGGSDLTYTPNANANGADSFTYTISDGSGGTATATVHVTITAVNDAPDAVGDTPSAILEDAGPTQIDVLGNDTDVDGDALTITGTIDATKGTVAITDGGTGLTYTPAANANGTDSFTYTIDDGHGGTATATVDITITAVNDPPVAGDDTLTVTEDQTAAGTVANPLANDSDVEGDTLTITDRTNGAKGIVTITGGGTGLTYKPNANAFGADSFTYTISDGNGGTATATVNVTITAVNDPPNAVNDGVPTPIRIWLNAGAQAIRVLANDTSLPDGPETLTITKVTQGRQGFVAITGGGTGLTYRPTGTTTGIDTFTYTISDGHGGTDTATVQVALTKDGTVPKAAITGLTKRTISGSTKLRLTLTWILTDTGSGLRSQVLQRRIDSGAWVTVSLASVSTRTSAFAMARGHLYTFRIRGTDRAGNVGLYAVRSIRT